MSAPIAIEKLSKWYGEVVGLNGIDAVVNPGVTGLLGPNGAGKTTLFRILTGLAAPSLGALRIFGQAVWNHPEVFRRIGFCPEIDSFYEEMRGRQFVYTLALIHGLSHAAASEATDRAMERTGMEDFGKKRISAMSKGMRQRVKVAQALVHDPDILLLDEPLNGMDPVQRHNLIELVRSLGKEGKTVLVSSHILYEVEQMTNNIILLIQGKILAQGSIREIRDLLDKHPRKIIVKTTDPRLVAQECIGVQGVVGVRLEGTQQVLLESEKPDEVLRAVTKAAAEGKLTVEELYSSDDNLESVFQLLVG